MMGNALDEARRFQHAMRVRAEKVAANDLYYLRLARVALFISAVSAAISCASAIVAICYAMRTV